ncbi:MAG: hypothetical protein ABSA12_05530 [Verrucomicrobiia bacterium]|jgi:hypothetical protein
MHQQKHGPRAEYRQEEGQRVKESATLGEVFQKLKRLTVNLEYSDPQGVVKSKQVKYEVNLANAKSVFRFNCLNDECIRGDFDLSNELAKAVSERRSSVSGEVVCQGWRSRTTIDSVHCHNILRYTLSLGY